MRAGFALTIVVQGMVLKDKSVKKWCSILMWCLGMKGWILSKLLGKRCLYLAKEHDVEVGSTLGRENVIISVIQMLKVSASYGT